MSQVVENVLHGFRCSNRRILEIMYIIFYIHILYLYPSSVGVENVFEKLESYGFRAKAVRHRIMHTASDGGKKREKKINMSRNW